MNSSPKSQKSGGIFRVSAIAPIGILTTLLVVYVTLFLDTNLRWGLEWALGSANGAEVNIASLKTRLASLTLEIRGIALTAPETPTTNRLEIGSVTVRLNPDAALRAKAVIEEATVLDLQSGAPRARAGKVYPPKPADPNSATGKILARIQEEASQTGVAQLGQMLKGFNPNEELKKIGNVDSLQSLKRVQGLEKDLTQKQAQWTQSLTQIPGEKELAALQSRVAGIKIGGSSNPAEIQGQITQALSVTNEAKSVADSVRSRGQTLVQDVNGFSRSVSEIDELVARDRQSLASRLKLPQVDSQSLTRQLVGPRILGYVAQAERLVKMGRSKAGSGKPSAKADEESINPFQGVNYEFGSLRAYPAFWLKRAEISSRGDRSTFKGDVQGLLTDWSSNSRMVGKPSVAQIRASFPKHGIEGLELAARLDRSKDPAQDHLSLALGALPVGEASLSDSPEMRLGVTRAHARGKLSGEFEGESVAITGEVGLKDAQYAVSSSTPLLEQLVREATQSLSTASVGVKVTGTWQNLQLALSSTLGDALERAFRSRVEKQVAEVRAKIDHLIHDQIDKPRAQLMQKFGASQSQVTGQVDARQKQADGVTGQAQGKVDQAKNQLTQVQNQGAKKAADAIRGKLPF